MISKLPNLRTLNLRYVFEEVFKLYETNNFNEVGVDHLCISWKEEIKPDYIKSLKYMFNLSKLTALELHFCSRENPPPEYESDLLQVLSETSNLTQLSITSKHVNFAKLISSLTPNSLTSLYIRLVPPFKGDQLHYECEMQVILKTRLQSISRISFSRDRNHHCQYGLDEFDKIYQIPCENYKLAKRFDLAAIRQLLSLGCSQLKQALYNDRCYFISRDHDSSNPEIISVNTPQLD